MNKLKEFWRKVFDIYEIGDLVRYKEENYEEYPHMYVWFDKEKEVIKIPTRLFVGVIKGKPDAKYPDRYPIQWIADRRKNLIANGTIPFRWTKGNFEVIGVDGEEETDEERS